ncbi:AbiU2 domain-containing protein [Ramlibacter montanisoli]|uniref:HEPN AbiU2-like domain-containing protein n=1 Tax=Ramlibacter montanisoli TaxID=2732512 RepID=A0A849KCY6_9BURK|nr:hypothetical protein [Ramlibacter montanisoli]NNU45240.1 hypothetical protein [Ramlibacter montanisoli]
MHQSGTDHRTKVVQAFCNECVWACSIRTHFADLFEFNEARRSLLREAANTFFGDLNILLVEYIILQQCKLTDPADSGKGKENLTTDYILSLGWMPSTQARLQTANTRLRAYRDKIADARRKLIAHADLRSHLLEVGLGMVTQSEETAFWDDLQEFVDAAHGEAVGGPFPIHASMPDGDVASLVHVLRDGVDYDDIVKERPDLSISRYGKRRYGDV